ncbi:phosphoglycerate dehydrogenase [Oceanospirillaceae bacterium]|jgi:phosphoglycerate dehydrogenase-like enzyme|nr:phosphoglycerate dehydrogenase [bacterium]MDB4214366.1 phosphoglycerate dehydrogenase [Oceanospirillaceae bacterium]
MNALTKVAVCSRSFSKNPVLRAELLERYSNVTFNEDGLKLNGNSLVEFLKGHDKAITALEKIDESVLSQLPDLKVIGKYGVGLDMIDMVAMRNHGTRLGWTGGVNRRSVSELVISFAIALLRHVPAAHHEVLSGTWRQHIGGCLSGRIVGIIGCGHIGKDLVPLLEAFGCSILVSDIVEYPEFYSQHNIVSISIEELLRRSDIVTLHVPLDNSTLGMINEERLSLMKPTAILINTARGGLIDEVALKVLLQDKRLAAAALDVFLEEPPQDQELLNLPNFLVTPHIGGSSDEAILAMGRAAISGLDNNDIPDPNIYA